LPKPYELIVLAHDLKIPPHPSRPRWRLWMGYPFDVLDDPYELLIPASDPEFDELTVNDHH
jgi:hypothetical protein